LSFIYTAAIINCNNKTKTCKGKVFFYRIRLSKGNFLNSSEHSA